MTKIYKTANGQEIDMQRLMLKNEEVRAVGNMNVNARGDVIDNGNKVTSARSAQVNKSYRKQIGNVAQDAPVISSSKKAADDVNRIAAQESAMEQADEILTELDRLSVTEVAPGKSKTKSVKAKATTKKDSGLAAAIAKAKEAK